MSGNDYVKYMTEQVVTYIDTPRDERKSRKKQQNSNVSSFSNKWLGVLPFALKMFMKKAE
ncbi:YqzE family protein [Virgibacillus ndiopensis]|uniref:YqzE family protein n=1 Tax=Virgibacillus ndiopensis TaxID=2004408 RepID=UPI000C078C63